MLGWELSEKMNTILRIIGNSVALYAATWAVSGFIIQGTWQQYLIAGIALGILNLTIRPILKAFSMPLIILTLGLFTIVINAIILWLVDYAFDFVAVADVWSLVMATIIVAIVNFVISLFIKII